ncbi:hypothetical protein [uncultured Phycicoccus sp.]|uniref:hypothetical protein n=1 Tax=uncultured Phycicoccus sp. TaxID=661422 RepID=UPI002629A615|nr:hypothetical protein [uncultured Phycicoccus sp.]
MPAVAVLVVGCSGGEAGHAFLAPEGFARSGISVAPGETAVVGLGRLRLADPDTTATLTSLDVQGEQVAATAGRVLGVKVYRITDSGGIGAITAADLAGVDGNGGWQLTSPDGAVVSAEQPLGVAVVVQGDSVGSWSSDSLVVEYVMDGREQRQRIAIGAGVCVVTAADEDCDPSRAGSDSTP